MKIITKEFKQMHLPIMALVIYEHLTDERDARVEAYEINKYGQPVNAHPLTENETKALVKTLSKSTSVYTGFLQYHGVIPDKVLFVDAAEKGYAIWYTPAQKANLLFTKNANIPSGEAHLPPLVWKATNSSLQIFALTTTEKPSDNTPLYHTPFFNVYHDGRVCMGTVNIEFDTRCNLPDFMAKWEHYFFNSYFSHAVDNAPLKKNLISLWQQLIQDKTPFPLDVLQRNGKTIKDLIV